MKNKRRRLLSAMLLPVLTAMLLWMLTGCKTAPSAEAEHIPANTQTEPETQKTGLSLKETHAAAEKQPPHGKKTKDSEKRNVQDGASDAANASLALLRDRMDAEEAPDVQFAVAYLGYIGGLFDEGFEAGFSKWLAASAPCQLQTYPFLAEIDPAHVIGGVGHLYCIVPRTENASIAVNRVHWDGENMEYAIDEVAYRAESGEPVLLFANLDGDASIADTVVTVVSENGDACEWYPALHEDGSVMMPGDGIGGLMLDFTEYADVGTGEFGDWMVNGWSGPTALSLAGDADMGGLTWTVGTRMQDGRDAFFMLTFYPGDETGGRADLGWLYEGQNNEYEEQWSGWWTIKTEIGQPSLVTLDLTRVGGANYETADSPVYLSETYPVMISPSGESLMFAAGRNGIPLPFMTDSTEFIELLPAVG